LGSLDFLPGSPLLWIGLALLLSLLLILLLRALLGRGKPPDEQRPVPPTEGGPAPVPPSGPVGAYLVLTTPQGPAAPFSLDKESITIGRSTDNDLVIEEGVPGWETVSRHHARVYRQDAYWIVEDLGSKNGIYVNQQRTGRNLLQNGWVLGVGDVTFTFNSNSKEATS
jgi:hypothetical protein